MQAFCRDQQAQAQREIDARIMQTIDRRTIRNECVRRWPFDRAMQNFCEGQELEALRRLGR